MVVVTLGHRLVDESIHPHLRRRVDVGLSVFEETDARALLFTGGETTPGVSLTEGTVMRSYAIAQGVNPQQIHTENRALDTIGNGYFSRLVLDRLERERETARESDRVADREPTETVFVVTADYHSQRAAYVFEQCFGDAYEIDTTHCVETTMAAEQPHEQRSLERTREFFEPISPGDVSAIGRRLVETHDLYDAETIDAHEPILATDGR